MKYHVNQRVKMINSGQGLPDQEGIITAIGPFFSYADSLFYHYLVRDVFGRDWYCVEDKLVPILPEGWKKTHWDQCLWQPEEYQADPVMEYMRVGRAP